MAGGGSSFGGGANGNINVGASYPAISLGTASGPPQDFPITIKEQDEFPDLWGCENPYCLLILPSQNHHKRTRVVDRVTTEEYFACGIYCSNEICGRLIPEAEYHKRKCGVTGCQLWDWTCPNAATSHSDHSFPSGVNSQSDVAEEDDTTTTTNPNTETCDTCGEDYDPANPGRHIASSCGQTGPNGESCTNDYHDCSGAQHQHSW